jgi:hypothetical protein
MTEREHLSINYSSFPFYFKNQLYSVLGLVKRYKQYIHTLSPKLVPKYVVMIFVLSADLFHYMVVQATHVMQ